MEIGYVYMVTCIITGKIYIGSTKNFKKRFSDYKGIRCHKQLKLYRSLNKHGVANHTFEVIWEGTLKDCLTKECVLGNWFEVLEPDKGLNLSLPKIDDVYQHKSLETRAKLSLINLGKKHSIETRLKLSISHKGLIIPAAQRLKMAQARIGLPKSEETRRKIGDAHRGRKYSEELVRRMSMHVVCSITGDVLIAKEAAIQVGCSKSHFIAMMSGKKTNKTTFTTVK